MAPRRLRIRRAPRCRGCDEKHAAGEHVTKQAGPMAQLGSAAPAFWPLGAGLCQCQAVAAGGATATLAGLATDFFARRRWLVAIITRPRPHHRLRQAFLNGGVGVVSYILDFGAWNWIFVGALLFILEVFLPGVFLLWFGFAAAVVGVLALTTGMSFGWQVASFGVVAVISVLVGRRVFHYGAAQSDRPFLNLRGKQYVGRTVVVEEPITNGRGRVRVGDTLWVAEGPDTPAGARVKVVGSKSTILIVEPAPLEDELPKAGTFS